MYYLSSGIHSEMRTLCDKQASFYCYVCELLNPEILISQETSLIRILSLAPRRSIFVNLQGKTSSDTCTSNPGEYVSCLKEVKKCNLFSGP